MKNVGQWITFLCDVITFQNFETLKLDRGDFNTCGHQWLILFDDVVLLPRMFGYQGFVDLSFTTVILVLFNSKFQISFSFVSLT